MTKNTLHRRTFLRGLGVALSLPLLESMALPRPLFAGLNSVPKVPTRAAFIFFPNGVIVPDWRPRGEGRDYTLGKTVKCLEPLRDKLSFYSGLAQYHAKANGDGPGDHARNAAAYLTGAQPFKTDGANISVGISVDQAAATEVGSLTRLPSLELGTVRSRNAGGCDSGYSCAYSSNVSWKTPTQPMAKEINPRLAFERLFGSLDERKRQEGEARRNEYRQSILDMVADDTRQLRERLGDVDRRKLDEYLTSVRELEERIARTDKSEAIDIPENVDVPRGVPRDYATHVRLMYDIMALAFQTDSTRICTFMLENAGSNRSFPAIGVRSGHHEMSHHRNDAQKMADIQKIDQFYAEQFAYFLQKLDSIPEGDGTLLDNSMILFGSAISDGNRHQHNELPIILAGSGSGTLPTGQHLRYERDTPLNNLFLSMTDRLGCTLDTLGDSESRLAGLEIARP